MRPPSSRQNRVDPWNCLVATPERGLFMGNRGCLHNEQGRIVRTHQVTRWIICVLDFRGRKRTIMQPGHYTELFFLDEATALAAGHRPCAECRREQFDLYASLWAKTQPRTVESGAPLRAPEIDAGLHAARWLDGHKRIFDAQWGDLPSGVMVAEAEQETPYLVWQGQLWQWSFDGYAPGPNWPSHRRVRVLTPKPTVEILAAGYTVQPHPTLYAQLGLQLEAGFTS